MKRYTSVPLETLTEYSCCERELAAERALLKAQADLKRAQQIAHVGNWRLDGRTGELNCSDEVYRIFEMPVGEAVSHERLLAAIHPDDRAGVDHAWQAALHGAPYDIEHRILVGEQEKWVHEQAELVFDAQGALLEAFGTVQDVTARNYAKQALRRGMDRLAEQDNLLRAITENSPDPIFLLDRARRMRYANPATLAIIRAAHPELSIERIIGQTFESHFDDPELVRNLRAADDSVLNSGRSETQEIELSTPAGRRLLSILRTPYRDASGQVAGLVGMARDITRRKQEEAERLEQMARQRNALVREVHHRIKNHLQGVIGLLSERLRTAPQLACMLEQTIADLQVIAQAYGLQAARDDAQVMLGALVRMAVQDILLDRPMHCRISPATEQWSLPERDVLPLALVLNELLANAAKHCSADGRAVQVTVDLRDGEAVVGVRNGPARLPAGFDLASCRGLGTGLNLALTLLPHERMALSLRQEDDEVVAELRVRAAA